MRKHVLLIVNFTQYAIFPDHVFLIRASNCKHFEMVEQAAAYTDAERDAPAPEP